MTDRIVVFITVASRDEAEKIANVILEKRLAACVNIVPSVVSMFHWEGKIEKADELLLIIKTKLAVFEDLKETVKKVHSYTVPEIIALPITTGSEEYLKWLDETIQVSKK